MTNREALLFADARSVQRHIARLREEEPKAEAIAAITQGNKEFREGRFVDLGKLCRELDDRRRRAIRRAD